MTDPASNVLPASESRTFLERRAGLVRGLSILLIVLGIFLIMGSLPIDVAVSKMEAWLEGLGILGPIVFGLIYVVATIFMLPGSALTLAAGAIFGLIDGTVIVSISSTTGAALALLTSRYLARDRISKRFASDAKFTAIDRALETGGWKIVAMLRLSPAVPFNLQNYLYGLTKIPFWTAVLTSWIAMLPGTILYVYLGYIAKTAAEASGEGGPNSGKLAATIIGLVATVAVTIYITKLAKRELAKQTGIGDDGDVTSSDVADAAEKPDEDRETVDARPSTKGALVLAIVAIAIFTGGVVAKLDPEGLKRWLFSPFLPPGGELEDRYDEKPDGATFDHSAFDELLKKHVDANGFVDYDGLAKDRAALQTYISSLKKAPTFDDAEFGRSEKLALAINAYNAFTLERVLERYPALDELDDVSGELEWDRQRWLLGGKTWSLEDLEHKEIRPNFGDARIHFALVCAAVGCPPLRNEAYVGARLEEQLEAQTKFVHAHGTWFDFDPKTGVVRLTSLYDWYYGDFEQAAGSETKYAARYAESLKAYLDEGKKARAPEYLPYSWKLNSQKNAVPR